LDGLVMQAKSLTIPSRIPNKIDGREREPSEGAWLEKFNPATGTSLYSLASSTRVDTELAVAGALRAQRDWGELPGVQRGNTLLEIVLGMKARRQQLAQTVALETGKSPKLALGEVDAAIQLGLFFSGEGQRLYGRTTTSSVPGRRALTIRRPLGVAGLIVAANTPIANVAWKVFPALICGNAVVLKPPEDAPATAWLFASIAEDAGLPPGLLQIVQGSGSEAGAPLVANPNVAVVSFTGSTAVGRAIAIEVGKRLGRVSLELGGKNPFVVCDDANLELAVKWALLSAFSNAGQRCAAASRIIVLDAIYDRFRERFVSEARALKVGNGDADDFGPVINSRQLASILDAVAQARNSGCRVLCGGERLGGEQADGYYIGATVIEGAEPQHPISRREIFGPVTCLYRATDYEHALELANDSPFGLTACIHTSNASRALDFVERSDCGVAVVNAGTYGSEPHMPFGGTKCSGNGSREPGTEALDVYSSLKDVYLSIDPASL
jgi:alpha-ketoglutaric semialdehyde dehydrogenase